MTAVYRGRFAPSPTGPLHFGSLLAALASYLEARHHQGQWLTRIEDLDPLREPKGAVDSILHSLDVHGLQSDEPIRLQSQRHEAYEQTIRKLLAQGLAYPCTCSRKELRENDGLHPRNCRALTTPPDEPHAIRLRLETGMVHWQDEWLGPQAAALTAEVDDPVIKRKEGFYAYQLAVVVDDIDQRITNVVRGSDLLETTPVQIALYEYLGATPPTWLHIPVALNEQGQKLSKQNQAPALNDRTPVDNLWQALQALGQRPPEVLLSGTTTELLDWARTHWERTNLPRNAFQAPDSASSSVV